MPWLFLVGAICLEVAGTTFMKLSDGLAKLWPTIGMIISYTLCFGMLALSLKKIDLAIAYAIWSGLGTAIIAIISIVYFQESVSWIKIISIVLIISGVVGLNLAEH